ncbi:MAG: fibronectin type III domain-containing protein [Deltaproteobacteria bacterium]|nr:fibronectin type III domain-containing protein [Deltaproteobacteria bacterium]
MRRRSFWLIALLLFVLGCGRKAPPLSPEEALPMVLSGLQGSARPEGILLFWKAPPELSNSSYRIFRREDAVRGGWRSLGEVAPLSEEGESLFWDETVEAGYQYHYVARWLDSRGRWMGTSNEVVLSWERPMEAPQNLRARRFGQGVEIFWSPIQLEGIEIVGYVVYRWREREEISLFPITLTPVLAPPFVDLKIPEGGKYQYRVAAVHRFGDTLMQGRVSEPVSIEIK